MLDEEEFATVSILYRDCVRLHKHIEEHGKPQKVITMEELYKPCLDAYERLTEFRETNANAVMHHRLSLYGQPCQSCGKPLRHPMAAKCVACGAEKTS